MIYITPHKHQVFILDIAKSKAHYFMQSTHFNLNGHLTQQLIIFLN